MRVVIIGGNSLIQAFQYLGRAIGRLFEKSQIQHDNEKLQEMLKQIEQQPVEYTNDSWMWLWRKCGGIFYGGNKACMSGVLQASGPTIKLGRQRIAAYREQERIRWEQKKWNEKKVKM